MKAPKWSPRSQSNLLRERKLKNEMAQCSALTLASEKSLADLRGQCEDDVARALTGTYEGQIILDGRQREIGDLERKLTALTAYSAGLQKKIEALIPGPQAAKTRQQQQELLARLASERLGKDRLIDGLLQVLRQHLEERGKMTRRMRGVAGAIGLTFQYDRLDEERFNQLLRSLPAEELVLASEGWVAWFLGGSGKRASTKPFRVFGDLLVLQETLASPEIYHSGEEVQLTPEERRMFADKTIGEVVKPEQVDAKVEEAGRQQTFRGKPYDVLTIETLNPAPLLVIK